MGIRTKIFGFAAIALFTLKPDPALAQYQTEVAFPNLIFNSPVDIQHAGDGSDRLFVAEQGGVIRVFANDRETLSADTLLELTGISAGGERGLLGLAFHPDFDQNGYFYVDYTDPAPLTTVISRFSIDSTNANRADRNSEVVLLTVEQPSGNHNGGQLRFGPDGMLYIALGDGGNGAEENGQDPSTLLGTILRIDVDNPDTLLNYGIPPDNPFVGVAGHREEIYAYGLRNPWRFSFDSATGQLWAADVGQSDLEEIDLIESGKNYGWSIMEASNCYPSDPCDQNGLELPVWEYDHTGGNQSVTGGFVYRGSRLPGLVGKYIFGDYISGRIWALSLDSVYSAVEIVDAPINIPTFGVDENNELLIGAFDGRIYQLVSEEPSGVSASDGTFEDKVWVTWAHGAAEGTTFTIFRDTVELATLSIFSHPDFDGDPGVTYEYCVVQNYGQPNESNPVCDNGLRLINPPSLVAASDTLFDTMVRLSWQDNSQIEVGYVVRRDSIALDTLAANAATYDDATAAQGTAYQYCVSALDSNGFESTQTCDMGTRASVSPPANVGASDGTFFDLVRVTWIDQAADELGYNVRRDNTLIGTAPADSTQYQDSTAVDGITYTYCVSTVSQTMVESEQVCDTGRSGSAAPLTWAIDLSAIMGALSDLDNRIGASDSASTGFDMDYDVPKAPPAPGDELRLYFDRPEWMHPLSDQFGVDIRRTKDLTDTMQVWDLDVVSSLTGVATIQFHFSGIDLPVIVEDTLGARWSVSNGEAIDVSLAADSTKRLVISVGDTTGPLLAAGSSISGPRIVRAGTTQVLDWSVSDGFRTDSVQVYFSPDDGAVWSRIASLGDTSSFEWVVPDSALVTAAALRINATDLAGNVSTVSSDDPFAIAGGSISVDVEPGWTLWGPILDSDEDSVAAAIGSDFSTFWAAFGYELGGYVFAQRLQSASGYWLGAIDPATITLTGSPLTTDTTIALTEGWALVSDPFVTPVRIDSLRFSTGGSFVTYADAVVAGWVNSVYTYDGSQYEVADIVEPSEAFWLSVLQPTVYVEFPIHSEPVSSPSKRSADDRSGESWWISMQAEAGGQRDVTARAGVSALASNDFDPSLDAMEPPRSPGSTYVSLYSDRPDLNGILGGKLASDFRGIAEDISITWTFKLESSEDEVVVSWYATDIPDSVIATIEVLGKIYDVRTENQLTAPGTSTLRLTVRSASVGVQHGDEFPTEYELYQNYPNPFNPTTEIRFDIPVAGHVQLDVYDVLGRKADTLMDEVTEAGRHSAIWDAQNHASGVYVYRLAVGGLVLTRTMLLLK